MLLSYRLAESRDFDHVFSLYMDPAANPYLTFDSMSRDSFSSIYALMLEAKNLFVVAKEGKLVATYRLIEKTHRQAHILYLGGFTVKGSEKGQGIGQQILEHIKEEARTMNFKRIELTVDTTNDPAINLYRKVGFEIEGKLKNNYRLSSTGQLYDEYMMALLFT